MCNFRAECLCHEKQKIQSVPVVSRDAGMDTITSGAVAQMLNVVNWPSGYSLFPLFFVLLLFFFVLVEGFRMEGVELYGLWSIKTWRTSHLQQRVAAGILWLPSARIVTCVMCASCFHCQPSLINPWGVTVGTVYLTGETFAATDITAVFWLVPLSSVCLTASLLLDFISFSPLLCH